MITWDPDSVTKTLLGIAMEKTVNFDVLRTKYSENKELLEKLKTKGVTFRSLAATATGAAAVLGLGRSYGFLPHNTGNANRVICCALSSIIDHETQWVPKREMSYLSNEKMVSYVYDVYKYQDNKSLGNKPPFDRSMNSDPIKYRGAFYNQLTGRNNYLAVLPTAMKIYNEKIQSSWLSKLIPIMNAYPMFPALMGLLKSNNVITKVKDVTVMSDEDITQLSNDPIFSLMVLFVYFDQRVKTMTGMNLNAYASKTITTRKEAIDMAEVIAKCNGYPNVRKVWPKGGFTPSHSDVAAKALYMYFTTQIFNKQ